MKEGFCRTKEYCRSSMVLFGKRNSCQSSQTFNDALLVACLLLQHQAFNKEFTGAFNVALMSRNNTQFMQSRSDPKFRIQGAK